MKIFDKKYMFESVSRMCTHFELIAHECSSPYSSILKIDITDTCENLVDVIMIESCGFNIHTLDAIWNQLYNKRVPELTNKGCEYCDGGRSLIISKTNDRGIAIMYPNKLTAYGYDIHGSGSNGLITRINYCPMCGRKLTS